MLPCSLVGDFGEAADHILEEMAHLQVAQPVRVQADLHEAFEDVPQDAAFVAKRVRPAAPA